MFSFTATILRYSSNAEKTGWTFVEIPPDIIPKLKLKNKKGFRIKGVVDNTPFQKLSTYPDGSGGYIIALNAVLRRRLGKNEGSIVKVSFEIDRSEPNRSPELLSALKEDDIAREFFEKLTPSHQNYFHNYIVEAKTAGTKTTRIVNTVNALYRGLNFGEMIRSLKKAYPESR